MMVRLVIYLTLKCMFTEKGFCVRGDLCVYDHGNDPVVVESVSQYTSGKFCPQL